ncbi:MAG: tetratricopeptide repeat protein [Gammaproteobacteria bacterium]|nr:tetratricopeptide repeat protein [Gammaproteobacteria bacterium]
MKLVQRILSRSMLILVVILAAVGYHFRDELFPQWFGAEARERSAQSAPAAEAPPTANVAVQRTEVVPAQAQPAADDGGMSAASQPPTVVPPENSGFYAPSDMDMQKFGQPEETAPPTTAYAAPDVAMYSGETTPMDTPTATQTPDPLVAARHAFWAQDLDAAERLYRQAAEFDPASADALGELGNLYYAQGRWADAATVYAGAVERLAASGDQLRAEHLIRVLDGLDPERAQSLRSAQ